MKSKILLLTLLIFLVGHYLFAQAPDLSPWLDNDKSYGNEWIDYGKSYARVTVRENGVYKVSFDQLKAHGVDNSVDANTIEIWHRGSRVKPLQVTSDYVIFYGRKNDGASDGLLFRPGPEARTDKNASFFSDEGSYFFTKGTALSLSTINGAPGIGTEEEPFHIAEYVRTAAVWDLQDQRKHYEAWNPGSPDTYKLIDFSLNALDNEGLPYNQSYYESNNAYVISLGTTTGIKQNPADRTKNIQFPDRITENVSLQHLAEGGQILFECALHGVKYLGATYHLYQLSVSATQEQLFTDETRVAQGQLPRWGVLKHDNISLVVNSHVSSDGQLIFGVKSDYIGTRPRDVFGFSYYKITYPQLLTMEGVNAKTFYFNSGTGGARKIRIQDASAGTLLFDITDLNNPKQITNAVFNDGELEFDVQRDPSQELRILAYSPSTAPVSIQDQNVHVVSFDLLKSITTHSSALIDGKINPAAFDLLMVTNSSSDPGKDLTEAAKRYADYRGSVNGGSHRTLLISIRNIYDQFNYGEPSPIAIKRFVNYMLKDGTRPQHYLFLIGYGVTNPLEIKRELPDEVPSMGDPGSDVLLVCGLSNSIYSEDDIPAIPVGRLVAYKPGDVDAYREKVTAYENDSRNSNVTTLQWRKKILEISGTKDKPEIAQFKNFFNQAHNYVVHHPAYPWTYIFFDNEPEYGSSNSVGRKDAVKYIKNSVADGVGTIAYFGHGNHTAPLFNFETPDKGYTFNPAKYPFMYITGCGIGNIFLYHNDGGHMEKWLVAANKGAIAIVANSYDAYVSTASEYLRIFYSRLFTRNDEERMPLGKVWQDMVKLKYQGEASGRTMAVSPQDVAHYHQTNLLGDPTLNLLKTNLAPLPVKLVSFKASRYETENVLLEWITTQEENNSHFEVQRSFDGKVFETIGEVPATVTQGNGPNRYTFIDRNPGEGVNYYRLKQNDKPGELGGMGRYEFSNVISILFDSGNLVKVYPNPVSDEMQIESSKIRGELQWKLYDAAGMNILKGNGSKVNIKSLPAGTYILEIAVEGGQYIRRSVVKL